MADSNVDFEPQTGFVKLIGRDKRGKPRSKTLLRVKPDGIAIWDELQKKEIPIRLETLLAWIQQIRGR